MLVQLDAEKVRRAREERGLTKRDLAEAAGISGKTEARVEGGGRVRPKSARAVISALGSTREGLGGRPARRP